MLRESLWNLRLRRDWPVLLLLLLLALLVKKRGNPGRVGLSTLISL